MLTYLDNHPLLAGALSGLVFACKKCGWDFESGRITRFGCPKCGKTQPQIIDVANAAQLQCNGGNDHAGVGVERKQISEPRF